MERRQRRWTAPLLLVTSLVALALSPAVASSSALRSSVTPTTIKQAVQPGWAPMNVSARGVVVDQRAISEGGATFTVVRFRAGTVAFHWHTGSIDPPHGAALLPPDAMPRIMWGSEGVAGVVAAFNGGFKQAAGAGGVVADGITLEPLRAGYATLAINTKGQVRIGQWGRDLPSTSFGAVSYRQNLTLLVDHGVIANSARIGDWPLWGDTLHRVPNIARTAVGTDPRGNVIYAASTSAVSPLQLAQALVTAGASEAMEMDINPFWPILGVVAPAMHVPGHFGFALAGAKHSADVYFSGWQRDFFVVIAEPGSWTCSVVVNGVRHAGVATAQYVHFAGRHCPSTHP